MKNCSSNEVYYITICMMYISSIRATVYADLVDINKMLDYNDQCKSLNAEHELLLELDEDYENRKTVCAIQLGILVSLQTLNARMSRLRRLRFLRNWRVEQLNFPSDGSKYTPAHHFGQFTFRVHAPLKFGKLRKNKFEMNDRKFIQTMCAKELKPLSNSGKSGSLFYMSDDSKFIIKTMKYKEANFLNGFLTDYEKRFSDGVPTLLPKFFGLFSFMQNGKLIHFMVMNNLFPSDVKIHYKFDLKGSTYGRFASGEELTKPNPTYKDLDFNRMFGENGLILDRAIYGILSNTLRLDGKFLEENNIMDYSLLLGIHRISYDESVKSTSHKWKTRLKERAKIIRYWYYLKIQPFYGALNVIPAWNSNREKLLIYLGIIDILQTYGFRKRVEHLFKWVQFQQNFSVAAPKFYSNRFQNYMGSEVFEPNT